MPDSDYGTKPALQTTSGWQLCSAARHSRDRPSGRPSDFSIKSQRDKAEALIESQLPVLLIGSPMCTAFSAIQAINNMPGKRDPELWLASKLLVDYNYRGVARCTADRPPEGHTSRTSIRPVPRHGPSLA